MHEGSGELEIKILALNKICTYPGTSPGSSESIRA